MVLPLRLITTAMALVGTSYFFACAPNSGRAPKHGGSSEPVGEVPATTTGLAPIEAEPEDAGEPVERRGAREAPEQFEHQGVLLGLMPAECLLIAEAGEQRLEHQFEFPGECHFATGDDGKPRTVETDTGLALMVESSKPLEQDCDTALRVVVLTAAGPRLSKAEQRVAMCAPGGWDEMMFHVLASEPVSFGTAGQDP